MAKDVKKCPSYHLIASAVDGNEKDMYKLLQFYDAYISKACLRPFYDEYGKRICCRRYGTKGTYQRSTVADDDCI